jgi:hypothetical protein
VLRESPLAEAKGIEDVPPAADDDDASSKAAASPSQPSTTAILGASAHKPHGAGDTAKAHGKPPPVVAWAGGNSGLLGTGSARGAACTARVLALLVGLYPMVATAALRLVHCVRLGPAGDGLAGPVVAYRPWVACGGSDHVGPMALGAAALVMVVAGGVLRAAVFFTGVYVSFALRVFFCYSWSLRALAFLWCVCVSPLALRGVLLLGVGEGGLYLL